MSELSVRVTRSSAAATAVLAGLALGLGGPAAGLGVAAAGALMLANFWWLVRNARAVADPGAAPQRYGWALAAGARFLALLAALVLVLASGIVHPVAFVVGLAVLPGALIVQGLQTARRSTLEPVD